MCVCVSRHHIDVSGSQFFQMDLGILFTLMGNAKRFYKNLPSKGWVTSKIINNKKILETLTVWKIPKSFTNIVLPVVWCFGTFKFRLNNKNMTLCFKFSVKECRELQESQSIRSIVVRLHSASDHHCTQCCDPTLLLQDSQR